MSQKCSFGNVTIKPNGIDELDPCIYQVIEEYENVTVSVLQCKNCGHVEIVWRRQDDTICTKVREE